MCPDFSVTVPEIRAAGQCLADSSGDLSSLRLDPPDPMMYGSLVGAAAIDAEPATTEDINDLLRALGDAVGDLSSRAEATCLSYQAVEDRNAGLAGTIGSLVSDGGSR
ncbi:MAG TPA: hypothetical protein IAA98_02970 [Candidatus Avipropionibacterium avicola]|uniref:Uncharacterized protein n=1 Tax=Candidatus Avipropionibacterium avicola TaxID=2840701 RepID=A0A9D1KKS3_9ACTN|nr:hypothetical protein [Candidatus Avipropionibacterium avicola]